MDEKKIRSFRRNLRRFERLNQLSNIKCCENITLAQCHVLLEIETLGETTTKQLAKNLKLDKSTLSRTIEGLKRLELIKRATHGQDRRYILLKHTRKGKNKCSSLNLQNDSLYNKIFEKLSPNSREQFFKGFDDLVKAFSEYYEENEPCKSCSI
jgi:DNA-binding MarR family transcriptional regulator